MLESCREERNVVSVKNADSAVRTRGEEVEFQMSLTPQSGHVMRKAIR